MTPSSFEAPTDLDATMDLITVCLHVIGDMQATLSAVERRQMLSALTAIEKNTSTLAEIVAVQQLAGRGHMMPSA